MTIKVGNYEVYESGTVFSINSEPIEFFFPNFSVKVEFEESENKDDIKINYDLQQDNQRLVVKLLNFTNPLGTENTVPVEVGHINNRKLLFQFRTYAMDSGENKVLHYSWLLGEEVNNG